MTRSDPSRLPVAAAPRRAARPSGAGRVVLAACLLALAACSPPPVPDVTYFRLPPPAALPHAAQPLSLLPIEVESFNAEGVYAEQAIIYALTPDSGSLRAYHYQLWSNPPTRALQTRLVGMLRDSGIASLVTDRLPASTAALRIHGGIRRFERVKDGESYKVVVRLELRIEHETGEPVFEQEYAAEVAAADNTIPATVDAFGKAIDQVFSQFYADLVGLKGDAHAG
jgi:ABC-type uncharacterized transport system auxiliary subunit